MAHFRLFQVGALPHYQPNDMALYSVSNISSSSLDYTGSDYDTTNILHSSRQRHQYNFHQHGHDEIPNSNGHGTYISQSDLHCDRGRAGYSIGVTKDSSNHVPGDT